MKRLNEREDSPVSTERTLHSARAVMTRMCDVIWQADAAGDVTSITPCRPSAPSGDGKLDESEVARIEQLWRRSVRCAERFNAVYHVHSAGGAPRTFALQAVPVLDQRDEVLYWSGSAAEVDRFADAGSRFISEAAAVLSSSLSRATILNRLVETSTEHFADLCAFHAFDDDGAMRLEATADRRPQSAGGSAALAKAVEEAVRARQPLLFASAPARDPDHTRMRDLLQAARARSMIVAPLLVGTSCIGALSFLESERSASFGAQDMEVAVVVSRQLAMALENIKTFERERQITQRFRFLGRVTGRLFETLDSKQTLQMVLDALREGFADDAIVVALDGAALRTIASSGTKSRFREVYERQIVAMLRERRSMLVGDSKAGPFLQAPHSRSWMMAPLFTGDAVSGAIVCSSNAHVYVAGELELLEEIGRRTSLALDRAESFERERRLIQTLQKATLPTRLATLSEGWLSAVYRPAAVEVQVGGDWYDAYDLDDNRVLLTVGDVTGHGLEASIVMGKLRHAINVVAMYESDPVRILDTAERILLRRYPGSVATAFVAIFDSRTRTVTYANAGHPYPILRFTDGSLKELEADGLPIGLRSVGLPAKAVTASIEDASLLALFTDGLTEATRDTAAGELLLREALASDAISYVENPAEFVEKFCLRVQSPDDVAVLLLNFVKSQRWTFDSGDWRAARLARREFAANLAAVAPEGDLRAAELIFGELAANVAQHAGGSIEAALEWRGERAVLHITDRGEGYASTECNAADLLTEHGRGLWLIQRLGARLSVEVLPGFGTHVRAELPITRTLSP
jgi:GAF domain-containing protein/anti-sigma regulatory factor (Ser/Thr protein kinase)